MVRSRDQRQNDGRAFDLLPYELWCGSFLFLKRNNFLTFPRENFFLGNTLAGCHISMPSTAAQC